MSQRVTFALAAGATGLVLAAAAACSDGDVTRAVVTSGAGGDGAAGDGNGGDGPTGGGGAAGFGGLVTDCEATTCSELGWACGYLLDECGNVVDCGAEGLRCGDTEVCVGGIDGPTECQTNRQAVCELCSSVPDCSQAAGPTRVSGRVVTPGRDDADVENQVGVPNATVYVLRTASLDALPEPSSGIPEGGTSCDRCEDRQLGPVLTGAVTDAEGRYVLEGEIPVGVEMLLVVKVGQFRRATRFTLPAEGACETTSLPEALPENPTRLPRSMQDGLAAYLPAVAVSTGQIDAMECVLSKMGVADSEFGNPGDASARVHLFRGGAAASPTGASIDADTPHDAALYSELAALERYDMVVSDCEGQTWDDDFTERDEFGQNVRSYVNRGGRLFASHLSFSWLHENGSEAFSEDDPTGTGLGAAAQWATNVNTLDEGTGAVSIGRADASSRIDEFAAWMVAEGIASEPDYEFSIVEPRSQATSVGPASDVFVHLVDENERVQQFSFDTPYASPESAACGRVAYSGFHVSVGGGLSPFANVTFPEHCAGSLTAQEKVLLYMLFDLGICVGDDPLPPDCVPITCEEAGADCGVARDGCGGLLDCGACRTPE